MVSADLAIIGCGASAVLLLAAIARNPEVQGFKVDIYERTGNFGRGIAYSTPHKIHLLNVRAHGMSAYAEDDGHFASWAGKMGYGADDFVPRMVYGAYLDEILEDAKAKLTLNFLKSDVESARKISKESYELSIGPRKREYPCVVQATGNVTPIQPKVEGEVDSYINDPWSADYTALSNKDHIVLIGSGLSAVDTILALYAKNFQGRISVISRHGLFPAKHAVPVPVEPFLLQEDEKPSPYTAFHRLRSEIRKRDRTDAEWQGVINAMRAHTNKIWEGWTRREREKFMKRLFTFWNIHRHRMAPQIAEVIYALIKAGRIEVIKSSVKKIAAGPVVHTENGQFPCDTVINCMGYRTREEGRNFDVFEKIGPARFGEEFETTAIPEIRVQARDVAARILKKY